MEQILFLLDDASTGADGGGGNFVQTIFTNIAKTVEGIGSWVIVILGIVLIIISVMHVVRAFASRAAASWLLIIAGLLIGGVMAAGGWRMITGTLGSLGTETFDQAILAGSKPDAITDFQGDGSGSADTGSSSATGNAIVEDAYGGLANLADIFLVPFGTALASSIAVVLIVLSMIQIYKYFAALGRAQVTWLKTGAMLILGLCLFMGTSATTHGGWDWVRDILSSGMKEITESAMDGQSTDTAGDNPYDVNSLDSLSNTGSNDSDEST